MNLIAWINANPWPLFAWYAVSLFTASICLVLHVRTAGGIPRHLVMLAWACAIAAVGCVLGGMQSGNDPLLPPYQIIPWVRLCWTVAATLVMIECLLYLRDGYKKGQTS